MKPTLNQINEINTGYFSATEISAIEYPPSMSNMLANALARNVIHVEHCCDVPQEKYTKKFCLLDIGEILIFMLFGFSEVRS